jgi:hypothetical protein
MYEEYEAMSNEEQYTELSRLVRVFQKSEWNQAIRLNGTRLRKLVEIMMQRKLGKSKEAGTVKLFD